MRLPLILVCLLSRFQMYFFRICLIQLHLREWDVSEHKCLHLMADPMLDTFEKYWEDCCLVLAIVVVLDPKCKLVLGQYYYDRIYGKNAQRHVERVQNIFTDLFSVIGVLSPPP